MNLRMDRAFSLALLAGALGIGASVAHAGNYKGSFNLPVEARWGLATLAPGQYTVTVDAIYMPSVLQIRGEGKTVSVLAGPVNRLSSFEDRGRLKLVNINGTYVVKQFDAGLVGKSFVFPTPKALRNQEDRSAASRQTTVDVFGSR